LIEVHGILSFVKDFSNPFHASAYVIFLPFGPLPIPVPLPIKVYYPTHEESPQVSAVSTLLQ